MNKFKLPKEFAEKWIKALKSGEYKQGHYQLASYEGKYCCLGVAGKLANASMDDLVGNDFYDCKTKIEVPNEIKGHNELANELAHLNDDIDYTFEQIAHWIEENVELY